jgi:hypothetical protein
LGDGYLRPEPQELYISVDEDLTGIDLAVQPRERLIIRNRFGD